MINVKKSNICKFVSGMRERDLYAAHFVYETDRAVMQRPYVMTENRMILVTAGSGSVIAADTPHAFAAGDLIFAFKGETVSFTPSGDCEYIYIGFSGSRADELLRRFGIHPLRRVFFASEGLIPLWQESLLRASTKNIDLAAESMLLYGFSRLSAVTADRDSPVRKVMELIEEHFTDPALSIAAVAERLSYHPKYLSRVFKDKMGVRYTEYLRAMRMKYAVSLFDHGLNSVKNVALLSGFSDPFYFSTVFKSIVGITPKEYIEKNGLSPSDE